MSCSLTNFQFNKPKKYKSLYVGDVECPNTLEGFVNGIFIKVIDVQEHNIDYQKNYNINSFMLLKSANAKNNDAGIDIYYHTITYLKYLMMVSGRNSPINETILISLYNVPNLDNAFFTGSYMVYGNGATMMKPLVSADIISHELTHGLCQTISGLIYFSESGALNESLSDIVATGYEFYLNNEIDKPDFEIGEMVMINEKYLRTMSEPRKYKDEKWISDPNIDYGGVHYNSALLNYLFYLINSKFNNTEIHNVVKLFITIYSRLKQDSNFKEFSKIMREEVPVKWNGIIINCLNLVNL